MANITVSRVFRLMSFNYAERFETLHISTVENHVNFGYNVFISNKNSSGDEIANVNFHAVRPEGTRIR